MICLIKLIIFCLINSVHSGLQCLQNPCINGICIDDVNSTYTCYCQNGFTGIHCETNWNECWSSPCQHNGICIDGIGSFTCSCPEMYSGILCEVDLNQCASNPCQNNATCINTYGSFLCECIKGFSGQLCNIDDPVCNTSPVKCANNATCVEGFGDQFSCTCQPGWTGTICDLAIDMCDQLPCLNGGLCINYQTYYMCACAFGFYGKTCDQNLTFCDQPNPCQNNALCLLENNNEAITCYCIPDFFGQFCQFQYNDCQLNNTCQNNGICIDGINTISCQCPDNFTGQFCEVNISNSSLSETFSFSGSHSSGLSSFLQITLPFSQFDKITIQFKFCLLNKWDQISLILFIGNDKHNIKTDHIAVTYVQGYLMLTWSVGYGPRRIFIKNPLKDSEFGEDHKLFLQISHNFGLLIIDDLIKISDNGISYKNSTTIMKTNSKLYLGGYYSRNFNNLPHDLPKHSGFIGCISDVQINNQRFPVNLSRFIMKNCTVKI